MKKLRGRKKTDPGKKREKTGLIFSGAALAVLIFAVGAGKFLPEMLCAAGALAVPAVLCALLPEKKRKIGKARTAAEFPGMPAADMPCPPYTEKEIFCALTASGKNADPETVKMLAAASAPGHPGQGTQFLAACADACVLSESVTAAMNADPYAAGYAGPYRDVPWDAAAYCSLPCFRPAEEARGQWKKTLDWELRGTAQAAADAAERAGCSLTDAAAFTERMTDGKVKAWVVLRALKECGYTEKNGGGTESGR